MSGRYNHQRIQEASWLDICYKSDGCGAKLPVTVPHMVLIDLIRHTVTCYMQPHEDPPDQPTVRLQPSAELTIPIVNSN